ncbi:hypothetical protein N431DRAFT_427051 [Stipitochalara longipes BDJ]|nr:hypothetical protein N431DRAFT_427051 [Stipitochalara longipes BDJ]
MNSSTSQTPPSSSADEAMTSSSQAETWALVGKIHSKAKGSSFRTHQTNARERLHFTREADNEIDSNAIKMMNALGQTVGYLERELALKLAPHVDSGSIRLRGKTLGKRGSKWNWHRPDISIKVFSRSDLVGREQLEQVGVIFSDGGKDTSSTDGSSNGSLLDED